METEVVHVTLNEALNEVDAVLHDAWFSLDEVQLDEAAGAATLAFASTRATDLGRSVTSTSHDQKWVLRVFNVSEMALRDPAHLVEHSYARITLSADGGLVTISSNFPGGVDFMVSDLDVRLAEVKSPVNQS